MNRPLLFLERILYGDGTEPFNGVFALRLKGAIDPEKLRYALDKVQARHPALSATVAFEAKKPWFRYLPEDEKIPLLVKERHGDTHWQQEVIAAWNQRFEGVLLQVSLLQGAATSELILAFHHCLCDGGGGMILVRDLLAVLDDPKKTIGFQKAGGRLEHLIPKERLEHRGRKLRSALSGILLSRILKTASWFIRSRPEAKFSREADYLLHGKLSTNASDAWFEKCRAHQVTVNTALSAALLLSFEAVRGQAAHKKLSCPVDIRRFLSEEDRNNLFSFGLLLTMQYPKRMQQPKNGMLQPKNGMQQPTCTIENLWKLAREMQAGADRQLKKLNPYDFLLLMEGLHPATEAMRKTLTYGKVRNDLMFSNLGRLDIPETYSDFEIDTVFSPTVIGPFGNPTTVIASTYKRQLDLCFVSNKKYMDRTTGEAIFREAIRLIESPLN